MTYEEWGRVNRTMVDGEREREREREKDTLVLTAERRSRRQDNATQRRHSHSAWQMCQVEM